MVTVLKICTLACFTVLFLAVTVTPGFQVNNRRTAGGRDFEFHLPPGLSKASWRRRIPPDNPMTPDKVALGQALYFDKRLSIDGTVSCATCHDPANAFTDHGTVAIGVSTKTGTRNAPTILNAMFSDRLFWDGRAGSLEEQAKQPLTNSFEMGMRNDTAVVERVRGFPEYRKEFRRVFKREGVTIDTIAKAIAAYERTQLSANSPFDRFIAGEQSAISEAQKRGFELFKGKAKCIECHSFSADSPLFTDFKFHNTGVVAKDINFEQLSGLAKQVADDERVNSQNKRINLMSHRAGSVGQTQDSAPLLAHTRDFTELGRYLVTKERKDIGAFKTPTLRDIELTTPYMHNGSEKTLIDVVRFYNRGGNANANLDERMRPLHLSDEQMNELIEFMRALTSDDVLQQSQRATPQTRKPVRVKPLLTKQ